MNFYERAFHARIVCYSKQNWGPYTILALTGQSESSILHEHPFTCVSFVVLSRNYGYTTKVHVHSPSIFWQTHAKHHISEIITILRTWHFKWTNKHMYYSRSCHCWLWVCGVILYLCESNIQHPSANYRNSRYSGVRPLSINILFCAFIQK